MLPADIISFLDRFAAGTNTEAEHQQFIDWLKSCTPDQAETALTIYHTNAAKHPEAVHTVDASVVQQIEAALNQYELGRYSESAVVKTMSWQKLSRIAAVLILMLGSSALFIYYKNNYNNHPLTEVVSRSQPQKSNELLPGGNKAKLTLANGAVITLDDSVNGKIARQGNTDINKSAAGQLVYQGQASAPAEVLYNTLTTPRGGQFKLVLPDGSEVWLNAASSVTYPTAFTGDQRKVSITGEAYFEIAHNPSQPFIVAVNGMEVKVLATHFNINAYNDEATIKTSLLQGSIQLSKGTNTVLLQPGQQAQLGAGSNLKILDEVDMDEVVAWKNGYFSFNRADLPTVMRQIARWYDVEISYEGKIPERSFGGKIDRNSKASEVLKILEESKVHFTIDNKKIIVSP